MVTILCIDDHAPTLHTLCLLFEVSGYRAIGATSAEEGRKLFETSDVDLVVLDQSLEDGDGDQLARTLKQMQPMVPIIMLSGWADLERPDCVDKFLSKPQEPKELLAAVLSLIVRAQTATA